MSVLIYGKNVSVSELQNELNRSGAGQLFEGAVCEKDSQTLHHCPLCRFGKSLRLGDHLALAFKTMSQLARHLHEQHGNKFYYGKKTARCGFCGQRFLRPARDKLEAHLAVCEAYRAQLTIHLIRTRL